MAGFYSVKLIDAGITEVIKCLGLTNDREPIYECMAGYFLLYSTSNAAVMDATATLFVPTGKKVQTEEGVNEDMVHTQVAASVFFTHFATGMGMGLEDLILTRIAKDDRIHKYVANLLVVLKGIYPNRTTTLEKNALVIVNMAANVPMIRSGAARHAGEKALQRSNHNLDNGGESSFME